MTPTAEYGRLRSFLVSSASSAAETLPIAPPGDLDQSAAEVELADAAIATKAMDDAARAFPDWAATPLADRISLLRQALALLEARSEDAARRILLENGKPLPEARAEAKAALADGLHQLDLAERFGDEESIHEAGQEVWHAPAGVFLLITPWNFPLATVVRKLIPALAWGNAAVCKPAQQTPLAPALLFQCLAEAGIPAGAAQLLIGKGSVIGDPLVDHPALAGISFTGSTEVGVEICRRVAGRPVRTQMEMGGKNALVVLADGDLEAAARAAVTAAFTCSGQWCTATSRVIVEAPAYHALADRLVEAAGALRMGPGHVDGVTFGPVASAAQKKTALGAIETARREGARLLCGGDAPERIDGCRGHFVAPTIFGEVTEEMDLFREEVFGPVLALTRARDEDDALRLANLSPYGLTFSVFTASRPRADRFMRGVEAGMVHHNLHTAVRHPALPVTGWKESGRGIPECGRYAREFYTRAKAVYRP